MKHLWKPGELDVFNLLFSVEIILCIYSYPHVGLPDIGKVSADFLCVKLTVSKICTILVLFLNRLEINTV